MRPKKTIAMYCADEDRRSQLRFMLTTNGFRVVEADKAIEGADCGLVVADNVGAMNAAYILAQDLGLELIVIARPKDWGYYPINTGFIEPKDKPEVILRRVREASTPTPGPKKGFRAKANQENQVSQLA